MKFLLFLFLYVFVVAVVSGSSVVAGVSTMHGVILQSATDVSGFNSAAAAIFVNIDGGSGPGFVTTVKKNTSTSIVYYVLSNSAAFAQNATVLWAANEYPQLSSNLSTLSSNHFGQSPSSVTYSDKCSFSGQQVTSWETPAPVSQVVVQCTDSLTTVVKTSASVDANALKVAVCEHLQLSACSKVSVSASSNSATLTINADPYQALQGILSGVYRPSRLSFFGITSVEVGSVVMFTTGSTEQDSFDGTFEECARRLWYLLFLILLVPLTYIVASKCYRRGKARGKVVAKEQDAEAKRKAAMLIQQQQRSQWMAGSARH